MRLAGRSRSVLSSTLFFMRARRRSAAEERGEENDHRYKRRGIHTSCFAYFGRMSTMLQSPASICRLLSRMRDGDVSIRA